MSLYVTTNFTMVTTKGFKWIEHDLTHINIWMHMVVYWGYVVYCFCGMFFHGRWWDEWFRLTMTSLEWRFGESSPMAASFCHIQPDRCYVPWSIEGSLNDHTMFHHFSNRDFDSLFQLSNGWPHHVYHVLNIAHMMMIWYGYGEYVWISHHEGDGHPT